MCGRFCYFVRNRTLLNTKDRSLGRNSFFEHNSSNSRRSLPIVLFLQSCKVTTAGYLFSDLHFFTAHMAYSRGNRVMSAGKSARRKEALVHSTSSQTLYRNPRSLGTTGAISCLGCTMESGNFQNDSRSYSSGIGNHFSDSCSLSLSKLSIWLSTAAFDILFLITIKHFIEHFKHFTIEHF